MSRYSKAAHATGVVMDEKIESVVAMDEQIAAWQRMKDTYRACYRQAKSRIEELESERERIRNLLAV